MRGQSLRRAVTSLWVGGFFLAAALLGWLSPQELPRTSVAALVAEQVHVTASAPERTLEPVTEEAVRERQSESEAAPSGSLPARGRHRLASPLPRAGARTTPGHPPAPELARMSDRWLAGIQGARGPPRALPGGPQPG